MRTRPASASGAFTLCSALQRRRGATAPQDSHVSKTPRAHLRLRTIAISLLVAWTSRTRLGGRLGTTMTMRSYRSSAASGQYRLRRQLERGCRCTGWRQCQTGPNRGRSSAWWAEWLADCISSALCHFAGSRQAVDRGTQSSRTAMPLRGFGLGYRMIYPCTRLVQSSTPLGASHRTTMASDP
jgi:hypothetical protein